MRRTYLRNCSSYRGITDDVSKQKRRDDAIESTLVNAISRMGFQAFTVADENIGPLVDFVSIEFDLQD